jgi:hypothetical protein
LAFRDTGPSRQRHPTDVLTAVIAGAVDYDPDPVEPPGEGSVLICCARPRVNLVLDL